jgi:AraC-like DNA-binding protein
MRLYIKYMVSERCKMAVQAILQKFGLRWTRLELGEVEVHETLTNETRFLIKASLINEGLELLEDHKAILIEKIKNTIGEMVNHPEEMNRIKFSVLLGEKLNHDYTYLANLFSEVTGTTIEQFVIARKIEKVKELLLYDELKLTEISYKLNYSSVSHLSSQFKKVTGLTPTFFKQLKYKKRGVNNKV